MFIASWFPGRADPDKIRAVLAENSERENGAPQDEDTREAAAYLLVTLEDGTPVAAARLALEGNSLESGGISVRQQFRGQGYEEFALRMLLYKARQMPYDMITARVFEEEIPLYQKFGFRRTGECVQKHGKTVIGMAVDREGIILEGACKQ
jgi:predicted GNAT family N-acyltransferase